MPNICKDILSPSVNILFVVLKWCCHIFFIQMNLIIVEHFKRCSYWCLCHIIWMAFYLVIILNEVYFWKTDFVCKFRGKSIDIWYRITFTSCNIILSTISTAALVMKVRFWNKIKEACSFIFRKKYPSQILKISFFNSEFCFFSRNFSGFWQNGWV